MGTDGFRGHLDMLLLEVISASPGHGYAVISALRERSGGVLDLTEGSVYPALHRLQERGLLGSDWQEVAGRRRRVYAVTADGRDALARERQEWGLLASAVDAVLRRPAAVPSPGVA